MIIGISKVRPNYREWLLSGDSSLDLVDLSTAPDPILALQECDALLLTGGVDIYPGRYGREDEVALCGEIDVERDALELSLIERAQELQMPVLAICRGLQLMNVALGGTLFADFPSQAPSAIVHTKDETTQVDARHDVEVVVGSLLHKIVRTREGIINSAHHQSARDIAEPLRVTARATDGIVEALEWKEPTGKAFLLAVQWHPERLERENIFASAILNHFLFEAASHAALKATA